ncbi:MAG: hypothetical protein ACE5HA_07090, partial [Anaerolineae bacterium]
ADAQDIGRQTSPNFDLPNFDYQPPVRQDLSVRQGPLTARTGQTRSLIHPGLGVFARFTREVHI